MEKQPTILVDVATESRVRIAIVGDIAAETNIVRRILLAETMKNDTKTIWQSKILRTIR
jgi:type II secretory pathway predicted ATPase ExeA